MSVPPYPNHVSIVPSYPNHISLYINESISLGIFPNCKIARVIREYKAGNKNSVDNYQPISTISVLSKLFERLMFHRLSVFFTMHSIIKPCQFGFRVGHNTTDAVLPVYTFFHENVSNMTIFLDFSKALDRNLRHTGLQVSLLWKQANM